MIKNPIVTGKDVYRQTRKRLIAAVLLSLLACTFGCKQNRAPRTDGVPVTDDRGRSVKIPSAPKRIVTLSTGDVEIFYAIGAQDLLVGIPDNSRFPPQVKSIDRIGGMYGRFNAEKIVGKKPDLVLMTMSGWDRYAGHLELLDSYHLTVLGLDYPSSFDGLLMHIRRLGCFTGRETRADSCATGMHARRDVVASRMSAIGPSARPRVYMEWTASGGRGSTCGKNDRDHELITMAGGTNIFGDVERNSITASDEEVIARNPQIIIMTADTQRFTPDRLVREVVARKGWNGIDAVRNNKIFVIDAPLTWANPRLIDGLEAIARILHPELYR